MSAAIQGNGRVYGVGIIPSYGSIGVSRLAKIQYYTKDNVMRDRSNKMRAKQIHRKRSANQSRGQRDSFRPDRSWFSNPPLYT